MSGNIHSVNTVNTLGMPTLTADATSHFFSKPKRNLHEVIVGCGMPRTKMLTVTFWLIADPLYRCHDSLKHLLNVVDRQFLDSVSGDSQRFFLLHHAGFGPMLAADSNKYRGASFQSLLRNAG